MSFYQPCISVFQLKLYDDVDTTLTHADVHIAFTHADVDTTLRQSFI